MIIEQPTKRKRLRRDKFARQQSLVAAATSVFSERGYDAATTREIAERAGCSEALIFRYFGGKLGLLEQVMANASAEMRQEMFSGLHDRENLEEELTSLLFARLSLIWTRPELFRISYTQSLIGPKSGTNARRELHEHGVRLILERLRSYQRAGHIQPGTDLRAVAYAIASMSLYFGVMCRIAWELPQETVEELARGTIKALCRGIAAKQDDVLPPLAAGADLIPLDGIEGPQELAGMLSRH